MVNGSVSQEGLIRGIRKWDLVAVAINGIIGAGIFGLPAKVYSLIGTYSLIAFVVCAAVVTLIILCFAEVGSRFEETGGPYVYAREAFGATVGFEVGWLSWLARLTAFAANCNLLVSYSSFFFPAAATPLPRTIIITGIVVSLTVINFIGVRQTAIANDLFTIGKLIPMLTFIAVGLFFLNRPAYAFGPAPPLGAFSQSVLLLIYAFTGFEMAAIPAGEIQDPRKNLPRALLIATGVVATVYVLIQVVCMGTLPQLGSSAKPLADAAQNFMGTAGAGLISAGAIISIAGNLNILVLSGSRLTFAFAENRQLPAFLAAIHRRFYTPYVSIVVTAALMLVLTLKSSFVAALTISAIARLVTYCVTCAALPVLRRRPAAPKALFRTPGGIIIAVAALVIAVWLLMNSTLKEAIAATVAAAIGLVIHLLYRFIARPTTS
jgi:amino acid transporter